MVYTFFHLLLISCLFLPTQVFFVIRLAENPGSDKKIVDPDGHISCDLMDGRDAFLTLAREKHYEFSSLRRAKFSTMAMLCEFHNQGKDSFVYTCNECRNHVETRYHCTVCDVSILASLFVCLFVCLFVFLYILSFQGIVSYAGLDNQSKIQVIKTGS